MDVIGKWTGSAAHQLQEALRMTNQAFAARLGVAERTVAGWHSKPNVIPRAEIQAALDTLLERADESVRLRFRGGAVTAQLLRVAIAVVVRGEDVLLVCRRDGGDISWQFPAGIVKQGRESGTVAVQETLAETGVRCAVRAALGSRLHPVTGAHCDYHLCDWLSGEPANGDQIENIDVTWVPVRDLHRFISPEKIYPPILAALEDA